MQSFHDSPAIMHVYIQVASTTQVHRILYGCRWIMTTVSISMNWHDINPLCQVLLRKINMHFLIFCSTEMVHLIKILPYGWQGTIYYASAFRCCRHFISGCLSVCMSVWSLNDYISAQMSAHLTNPDCFSVCLPVCLPVCPEKFPGIS